MVSSCVHYAGVCARRARHPRAWRTASGRPPSPASFPRERWPRARASAAAPPRAAPAAGGGVCRPRCVGEAGAGPCAAGALRPPPRGARRAAGTCAPLRVPDAIRNRLSGVSRTLALWVPRAGRPGRGRGGPAPRRGAAPPPPRLCRSRNLRERHFDLSFPILQFFKTFNIYLAFSNVFHGSLVFGQSG